MSAKNDRLESKLYEKRLRALRVFSLEKIRLRGHDCSFQTLERLP